MKTPDHTPGHISRAKDPAIVEESQNVFKTISRVLITLAVGLLIFISIMGIKSCSSRRDAEKVATAAYAAAHPPTPVTLQVVQVRTPYSFGNFPDNVIRVRIRVGEVDFYPQGGEIEICPPPPAKCWRDRPGIRQPRQKLPPGEYTITRIDPYATGVEIWN